MGLVYVEVEISNPARPELSENRTMLVDPLVTLSVLPANLLDRLGVRREGTRKFSRSGGHLSRDTGIVRFIYEGVTAGVSVIFGMEGDPVVMGVTALEVLGYQVDPARSRLVRSGMPLL